MASTPLHEPTFLILTALAEQPRYGYDVIQQVAALSDGRVKLRAGTLYGAFDRLTDQGWIDVDREDVVDGRLRRYYRLTDEGAEVLAAESRRLRANAEAATRGLRARAQLAHAVATAMGHLAPAGPGALPVRSVFIPPPLATA